MIVPAYTWIATWLAVTRTGADAGRRSTSIESTYNLDPRLVEAALSARTAAIVPVHLRGEPADMDAIAAIADAADLFVVEDAAQAHGARHRGRRVGSLGDAGAFSFYPTKNLGAIGDGGAVTTDDDELAATAAAVAQLRDARTATRSSAPASTRALAEMQAAALRLLLPRLDAWNEARASLAGVYLDAFGRPRLDRRAARPRPGRTRSGTCSSIGHPDREACARALAERGIETLVHYPVLPHRAPPYRRALVSGGLPGRRAARRRDAEPAALPPAGPGRVRAGGRGGAGDGRAARLRVASPRWPRAPISSAGPGAPPGSCD